MFVLITAHASKAHYPVWPTERADNSSHQPVAHIHWLRRQHQHTERSSEFPFHSEVLAPNYEGCLIRDCQSHWGWGRGMASIFLNWLLRYWGRHWQIYRCWVVWRCNYYVIIFPSLLFIASAGEFCQLRSICILNDQWSVSGYVVNALLPHQPVGTSIFTPTLVKWVATFYGVAVVQNGLTTGLITYKIWKTTRKSSNYLVGPSNLSSVLRILIESAALYFAIEVALLFTGFSKSEALNILQDIIPSIVVWQLWALLPMIALLTGFFLGNYLHPHHHPYSARTSSLLSCSTHQSTHLFSFSTLKKVVEDQEAVQPAATSASVIMATADSPCMVQAAAHILWNL
jgi:hypothetical protein